MRYISNLVVILISLNVFATYASEDIEIGSVKIVTGNYPPYYAASLPDGGPVAMNIMLACKEANLACKIDFLPWNRVYFLLEAGNADLAFSYSKNEERLKKYVFSREPVIFGSVSIFFLKSKFPNGIHFTEYKDLVGYTMLGDEDSWYAADFKKFGVETVWMRDTSEEWKMLLFGRGEAMLADTYQGLYELQQQEQEFDALKERIGFTERLHPVEHGYLMFSRPHFDQRRQMIRDSMDVALKKLDIMTAAKKMVGERFSGDARQVQ